MLRPKQISVFALLGLVTVIAMSIAIPYKWFTICLIEFFAILYVAHVLSHNLPSALRRAKRDNCRRADGSWSRRREKIERESVADFRAEMVTALLFLALPLNVLAWVVHTEVIPIDVGISAVTSFDISTEKWKQNLGDEEKRFDGFFGNRGPAEVESRKRFLWNAWPLVVGGLFAAFVGAVIFLKNAYAHSLRELAKSIQYRHEQYRFREAHEALSGKPRKRRRGRSKPIATD